MKETLAQLVVLGFGVLCGFNIGFAFCAMLQCLAGRKTTDQFGPR